jgi:hypothetical protein
MFDPFLIWPDQKFSANGYFPLNIRRNNSFERVLEDGIVFKNKIVAR